MWLSMKADHQGYRVIIPEVGVVHPGQVLTSMGGIAKGIAWYERGRLRQVNKKIINDALKWLQEEGFIQLESNPTYTLITLKS
jgi:hypothetical protein